MTISYQESSSFADVNGIAIHYNEAGGGPVLFGFHGGGPGANAWDNTRHNIEGLSKHFRVILMDLPGYGYSDKRAAPREGESLDQFYARLVMEFMNLQDIDRAHLYGSSHSGHAVLRFGLDYPSRIGKIILQASSPGGPHPLSPTPTDGIKALGVFTNEPTRENMERVMHLFIPRDELCTDELIAARFDAAMVEGHLESRRQRSVGNEDLRATINQLRAPVLVLWGHQDHMVPLEDMLSSLGHIPDVRVHIWGGGTGHFVQYEHADEFNRLVIDFLTH